MLKKKGIFGLLLVILLSVVVVEAKEALTADTFTSKMEELGYETSGFGDYVYAYPKDASFYDADETYFFGVYESAEAAQENLDEAYEETDGYEDLSRTKTSSGNSSCITVSGVEDGEYGFLAACRIDDTIVMGMTSVEEKASTVKDVMSDLGYYSSATWVVFVVLGVFAVIVAAVVIIVVLASKKKKNNMNGMYPNNGMNYGQPMNQGMNFGQGQPINQNMNYSQQPVNNFNQPMNQGMNFGQDQPINQNMNYSQQPVNNFNQPMNQGMNFGQDQPINQNMNYNQQPVNNFNQPVDNMNPNINNDQMNNNFPNIN